MSEHAPDPTRASTTALRARIESMLESYERESTALVAAQQRAVEPVTVWSADNLVRVTASVAGVVEVHLEPEAFKRSTPATLGATVTATLQEASRQATARQTEVLAPLTALADALPDLPDLIPGAPATKDLAARLAPPPPENVRVEDAEDEDDYFHNRDYLR